MDSIMQVQTSLKGLIFHLYYFTYSSITLNLIKDDIDVEGLEGIQV